MKIVKSVPTWVVHAITRQGGAHMPRMHVIKTTSARKKWNPLPSHYQDRHTPPGFVATGTSITAKLGGNLPNHDYRYFVGRPMADAIWSQCRYCRDIFYSVETRNEHHGPSMISCKKLLERAYEMLPAKFCVMCGAHKRFDCWGVPFCTEACKQSWRYSEIESVGLKRILPPISMRVQDALIQ